MNHPKGQIKSTDITGTVEFHERDLINVKTEDVSLIDVRIYENFANKGYYLNSNYNWQIIKDNVGELVLVPTKRK